MINIYEGVLKLVNPKLYNSPYKVNVMEVLNILKNFKFRCRISYLNNLKTLRIEAVPFDTMEDFDLPEGVSGFYNWKDNKIYLDTRSEHFFANINHELFHTSSMMKKKNGDSNYSWRFIKFLIEGITEYLNLKSKNKRTSHSNYQLEIFVVEFLIFIYGEKILEPYFQNNDKKFFLQFDNFSIYITGIEQFLSIIANNQKCQKRRLFYLCLTDRIPNVLKDDEEFLTKLTLDYKTLITISQHIDANKEIILKNIEQYGDIDIAKHQFKNQQKEAICDKFYLEYQEKQRWCFEYILQLLIKMAEAKGIRLDDIKSFVAKSLFYKNDNFKYLYTSSIESLLNFKVKKR